ncbi:hypothetical protein VC83_03873 [Pseudogymnoascus destructans]|uniref:Uncharacterized protein n=1 Tax=Pseudogymnoascus destructans TaxID=655981 RepID=A0A176ZY18_9PEZI|nr:uncharacterized protein VC83_09519 [Pseudogymnoascus destructans]XP_024325118.1 uncharacterized protein VC83_03873 [Pseudogymnoascus destructans]OAF54190.1 hypothetical protein VC83_09519 [Pseudogymnoascus destructans]OAF59835.1 hypothetical protein VC83_03873 [Pseudogymnoascus destructans]
MLTEKVNATAPNTTAPNRAASVMLGAAEKPDGFGDRIVTDSDNSKRQQEAAMGGGKHTQQRQTATATTPGEGYCTVSVKKKFDDG